MRVKEALQVSLTVMSQRAFPNIYICLSDQPLQDKFSKFVILGVSIDSIRVQIPQLPTVRFDESCFFDSFIGSPGVQNRASHWFVGVFDTPERGLVALSVSRVRLTGVLT